MARVKDEEMIGRTFGRLTVKRFAGDKKNNSVWECDCSCGKSIVTRGSCLRTANTTSCGCSRIIDEIGNRYGELVVTRLSDKVSNRGHRYWFCKCDRCGGESQFRADSLRDGRVTVCRCKTRRPPGHTGFKRILATYKKGAAERGVSFDLSVEQFSIITKSSCEYCGVGPSNVCKEVSGDFVYSGIDRINNLIGYEAGNCVPCCKICNMAKKCMTVEEFLSWVYRIGNHQYKMRPCPS